MFQFGLDDLNEQHLQGLIGTPESFVLEFKRELDLSAPKQRLEAAKDIAALANSQGGRLIYGISEAKKDDGSQVAETLVPLEDAGLAARLDDVIADSIHPNPHRRLRNIPVSGGFILVVEIYPSIGRDLHMTNDYRFYRRSETRTSRMSEPEVREAYGRLVVTSQALEQAMHTTVADQLKDGPEYGQAVLVIPWYGRRNLADPRVLAGIGPELANGPFKGYRKDDKRYWEAVANLDVFGDGLRSGARHFRSGPTFRFSVSRHGVVQLSDSLVFRAGGSNPRDPSFLESISVIGNTLVALDAARVVLERCRYWGSVQVVSVLRIQDGTRAMLLHNSVHPRAFTDRRIQLTVAEVNLAERGASLEPVVREMADQLFHHLGDLKCPFFSEDGQLVADARQSLPQS